MLKLLTWNICFRHFELKKRITNLCEYIDYLDPDIVCLQEVTQESFLLMQKWFLDKYHIYNSNHVPRQRTPSLYDDDEEKEDFMIKESEFKVRHFLIILSKYPLEQVKKIHFPQTKYHRFLFSGIFFKNNEKYYVCNTHLETFPHHEKMRIAQWKYCLFCAYCNRADHCFIMGDFNILETDVIPWKIPYGFTDVWEEMYPEKDGYTFDSFENYMAKGKYMGRLDRIYVTMKKQNIENIQIIDEQFECENEKKKIGYVSDHFGLFLQIKNEK